MIPQGYIHNFQTLTRAGDARDLCLLECRERATGQPAIAGCAVNRVGDDYELVPLARLFDGNPYELLLPPDPESRSPFTKE